MKKAIQYQTVICSVKYKITNFCNYKINDEQSIRINLSCD